MAQTVLKRCTKCGEDKPLTEYHKDKGQPSGFAPRCKVCRSAARVRRYKESGECERMMEGYITKTRGIRYDAKFGITLADYDEMLEEQINGCAICGRTPEENGQRLAVDHDHDTGKIRGLLCTRCNSGLGFFQDDLTLLLIAVEYLKELEV